MKRFFLIALFATTAAFAQSPAPRVADDGLVIDRVAEASKRDLPVELLKRIVNEDIDLLRGKRPDGTYEYASYERFEAGRITASHSVQPRTDKMATIEMRGTNIYRVIVDVPSRRMLVRKNLPVWLERVDVDFIGEGSTQTEVKSFEVKAWMQPGEVRPIDLPAIARQATVKVIATVEAKGGYGNLDVALVQAKIVDLPDSPFAEAVNQAKAALRALERNDVPSLRATAQRMREAVGGRTTTTAVTTAATLPPRPSSSEVSVTAPRTDVPSDRATRLEMSTELQMIEDLLTGTEAERREGLDRLHQLIRRMR
ncbi:MAG TPA: hypothetical protein VEK57_14635 [Thermoanaerobaculia bacterium]|nr:hypothetical protein [Thermoanaerobaculia bacterium]